MNSPVIHNIIGGEFCGGCDQDAVSCQSCGRRVCGNIVIQHNNKNIGPECFTRFGLGHNGTK